MVDVVSRVETQYAVEGLDTTMTALDRVAQAEARLTAQSSSLSTATAGLDRSSLSVARSLDAFTRGLDPLSKAQAALERGLNLTNRAMAQGVPISAENTRALANARARVDELAKSVTGSAAAHDKHGQGMLNASAGAAELEHSIRSMIDVLASGGSVFTAFELEAGRLAEVAGSQGGLSGAFGVLTERFKGVATVAGSMINPFTLVTGAAVGLGTLGVAALVSFEHEQDRLATSLDGLGRRSGSTVAQLNAVARAGAAVGGLSNSEASGLAATYTHAGLTPDVTQSLIGSTRRYSEVSGQGVGDAGSALSRSVADPVGGLGDLDKQFGAVDDALRQNVTNLERSGHMQEAQTLAAAAWLKAINDTTNTTWGLSRAFTGMENWVSNKFGTVGGSIAGLFGLDSPQDQLKRAQAALPYSSNSAFAFGMNNTGNVQNEISRLQRVIAEQDAKAASGQRDSVAAQRSGLAGDAVRSILPDLVRAQTAATQLEALRQALGDPLVLEKMRAGNLGDAQVKQAFGNAVVMQSMQSPATQQRQNYDLSIASTDAFSVGEKAVVEARRAELAVLRETGDLTRAATAATMTWNEAIAKGNSDAADREIASKQSYAMIGLSPFERAMQEVTNKYKGDGGIFAKDATTGDDVAKGQGFIKSDLDTASHRVAMALDDLPSHTERLASAFDSLAGKVGGVVVPGGAAATTGAGAGAALGTFDRSQGATVTPAMEQMFRTYVGAGYPAAAVAGFVGGTTTESGAGLSSTVTNSTGHYGIFQLDQNRHAQLNSLAGGAASTPEAQYAFNLSELNSTEARAGRMLASGGSVMDGILASDATERPGDAAAMARRGLALSRGNALLAAMQGGGAAPLNIGVNGGVQPIQPIASTMLAADQGNFARDQSGVQKRFTSTDTSLYGTPLGDATRALDAQKAALDTQRATFGQSASAIEGAAQAQQLWNKYVLDGVAPAGQLSKQTGGLADSVRAYGMQATAFAQQRQSEQDREKSQIGAQDTVRNTFSSSADTLFTGLARGQPIHSLIDTIGQNIGGSLIHSGVGMLTGGLFGKTGTSGGGLFGDLFGHMFAAGTNNAPEGPALVGEKGPEIVNLPAHAQVVPNNVAFGPQPAGHTFNFGAVHIHPVGGAQFTDDQVNQIRSQVVAGQQDTVQQITRDFPTMQANSLQAAGAYG